MQSGSLVRIVYRIFLFFTAILLTACSQLTEFKRPPAPVPKDWPTTPTGPSKGDTAKTHWRAYFTDPKLQALISASLEYNRDLRIAVARVEESRAQYGIARADKFPAVTMGTADYNTLFNLSFELDFWGRIASLSEAAKVSYLATEEARRAVHLSLVADVANAYFTILQLNELTALARSTVELREQSLALIAKGRDLGGAYDFEYQQANGSVEAARASLVALEHQRAVASNHLNLLVGQIPEDLPQGKTLDEQDLDTSLAPGLPAEVLLLRPDVMAAEQRLKAAHANIDAARAAFFPKIFLTAGLGIASQGLSALFSQGAWFFMPTAAPWPIFDGGRTTSTIELAEARKVIAVAEYEKTIQQAFREIADLLSARSSLSKQLRSATANKNSQAKRLEIAQARFNAGLISYLEVLDSQRELVAAENTSVQVRRAQLDSAAQLYKALGGGE